MRKIARNILLVALVIVELWLLTGLLPQQWQESMYARIDKIWPSRSPDYSRITHPDLDRELQPFKAPALAILASAIIVNGSLIFLLWKRRVR